MSALGCQTLVVQGTGVDPHTGDAIPDVPCGHLLGQHRDPDGGPCQIAGCGCPAYTPPADQREGA